MWSSPWLKCKEHSVFSCFYDHQSNFFPFFASWASLLSDSWAKLLRQASKQLLLGDGGESVRVWVLLATLHVMATDPKVMDHPSCVFTHFIFYRLAHQQRLDCLRGDQCLVGYQRTGFCPRCVRDLPLGLHTLFSIQPMLWGPDVLSHVWRRPPARLLLLVNVLIVLRLARVVKPGPGSRSSPLWSARLGSALQRPCQLLYPSYLTPKAGKARLTVPRCLRSLRLIFLCSRPPTLSAFQSSRQLEGDPFLLSCLRRKRESERKRKKKEGRVVVGSGAQA